MTTVAKIDESEQLRLEKELAEAFGWTNVEIGGVFDDVLFGISPVSGLSGKLRPWTREWHDCAELMVKHAAYPQADFAQGEAVGVTVFPGTPYQVSVAYESYEDNDTAVRCAVVEALTKKLVDESRDVASASTVAG